MKLKFYRAVLVTVPGQLHLYRMILGTISDNTRSIRLFSNRNRLSHVLYRLLYNKSTLVLFPVLDATIYRSLDSVNILRSTIVC